MGKNKNQVVAYQDITDNEVSFYKEQGYLVMPGFINTVYIKKLRDECFEVLEAEGISRQKLNNASETADKLRNTNIYYEDSCLDELINGERSLHIASRLIGGKAYRYFPFAVVKSAGGGGNFHFHQDNNYTQHEPAEGSLNIWVALVDVTPDNGCLQIVPGSHKKGVLDWENAGDDDVHKKIKGEVSNPFPVRMHAGDAIAFSRLMVHGSGKNSGLEPRVAYALQYHREDVNYLDKETNEWKKLIELSNNRFHPEKRNKK
ncbi:MAG: phytanoyl-CoA dioxygenase family protein [Bacteroidales bacterium]